MPAGLKLLPLLLAVWPASADFPRPKDIPLNWAECKMPGCAIVSIPDVSRMVDLYEKATAKVIDLERQLADLKQAKGCAKLEVTQPSKSFVPKKERDS